MRDPESAAIFNVLRQRNFITDDQINRGLETLRNKGMAVADLRLPPLDSAVFTI